ncbi:hypothetical protein [Blastococcus xanthinilyticus]|uniref:AraC-like protein n=1 Tax=Blastococcus xanthinilyticus TaxID=1564164 RepID=A0A5S5CZ25_9ACTN|nr:hypothetical protein [Blastococcus xanthinilyticus]TYP88993.1 hypothetical protein BD833_103149 [Blastococcus xanthinilyticus]
MHGFDTGRVPTAERARLVVDRLTESVRCRVSILGDLASVEARWSCCELSPGTEVGRYAGSAVRLTRRDADVQAWPADRLAFVVPGCAGSTLWQDGRLRRLDADALALVDVGAPYDYRGRPGVLSVVQLDLLTSGTTAQGARAAAPRLDRSSLYELARDHVRSLAASALPGMQLAALDDLGTATARLLSALLLSCGSAADAR